MRTLQRIVAAGNAIRRLGEKGPATGAAMRAASGSIARTVSATAHLDTRLAKLELDTREGQASLDDMLASLERSARAGDKFAALIATPLQLVADGVLSADQALRDITNLLSATGNQVNELSDDMRRLLESIRVGLQDAAAAKALLSEAVLEIDSYEDALELLNELHSGQAKYFADLLRALLAGKVTLQAFIGTAKLIARQMPGTELGQIATVLADAAGSGAFD